MVTDDHSKSGGIRPETTEKTTEDTATDTGPDYTDLEPISVPRGIVQYLADRFCEKQDGCEYCFFRDDAHSCWSCGKSPCKDCKSHDDCKLRVWGRRCTADCEETCWSFGRRFRCTLENLMDQGIEWWTPFSPKNDRDGVYTYFDGKHHPISCTDFARWYLGIAHESNIASCPSKFAPQQILLALNPPFVEDYVAECEKSGWRDAGCCRIADPMTHLAVAFRRWLRGPGRSKWHFDSLNRPLLSARYRDILKKELGHWFVWGHLPDWFRADDRYYDDRAGSQKGSTSDVVLRRDTGFPLVYATFSPERHPTSAFHLALWRTSLSENRGKLLEKLHWKFIEWYFTRMEAAGWKNPDETHIDNALKHILDAFTGWRMRELAKPKGERACEFDDNGFPTDIGAFQPYLDAAWAIHNGYWKESGAIDWAVADEKYDALAFRGLVTDTNGVRKLPLREIALRPWLYKEIAGFDEDEKLFPASVAKALIDFRHELGDISDLDECSTATRVSLTIGAGLLPEDGEDQAKGTESQRSE